MYLDASAIVAIIAGEADAPALAARVPRPPAKVVTSPVSVFEATVNLARIGGTDLPAAEAAVAAFLRAVGAEVVPITAEIGSRAIAAYGRYGRGFGKAALNMGDAFSYACAKSHRLPLLYKGKDFQETDLG